MTQKKRLGRRAFLSGLGLSAAALPMMPLLEREAAAQSGGFPKRFIVFCTTTGMTGRYPGNWLPSGSGNNMVLSDLLSPLKGGTDIHGREISDLTGDLILTQGINMDAAYDSPSVGGHPRGMGVLLTGTPIMEGTLFSGGGPDKAGWAGGISIDQHIANNIGQDSVFKSLELGVDNDGGVGHLRYVLSYADAAQPIPVESDPVKAFDRIFGQFTGENNGALVVRKKRQQGIVDHVRNELNATRGKLGAAERYKLDAHLTAVESIEKRLLAELPAECVVPDAPADLNPKSDTAVPALARNQIDMLVTSMACGLTNVGSLMLGPAPYGNKFTFLPEMLGNESFHQLSHSNTSDDLRQDQLEAVARFYASQFAYLVQSLKDVPEGEGTMLDNTVVLWATEVARPNNHSHNNIPFVLAGSGSGYFETGRLVEYNDVPHNQLFVSICHAMGLDQQTVFGDPRYGSGPLTGLT